MKRCLLVAMIIGLVVVTGEGWAIVGADNGSVWVQSPWRDKIALTNTISFELGGSPEMYLNCIEKTFQDPTNTNKTIIDAAKECKAKNQQ
jgi:hypothetical protein